MLDDHEMLYPETIVRLKMGTYFSDCLKLEYLRIGWEADSLGGVVVVTVEEWEKSCLVYGMQE